MENTTYKIWDNHNKAHVLDMKKENHFSADTLTEAQDYLEKTLDRTELPYSQFVIEVYVGGKYSRAI